MAVQKKSQDSISILRLKEIARAYIRNQVMLGKLNLSEINSVADLKDTDFAKIKIIDDSKPLYKYLEDKDIAVLKWLPEDRDHSVLELVANVLVNNMPISTGSRINKDLEIARNKNRAICNIPIRGNDVESAVNSMSDEDNTVPEFRSLKELLRLTAFIDVRARKSTLNSLYNLVMTELVLNFARTGSPTVRVMLPDVINQKTTNKYRDLHYGVGTSVVYGSKFKIDDYAYSEDVFAALINSFEPNMDIVNKYYPADFKKSPKVFFELAKDLIISKYNWSDFDYIGFVLNLRAVAYIFGRDVLGTIFDQVFDTCESMNFIEVQSEESFKEFCEMVSKLPESYRYTNFKNYCELRGIPYADQTEFVIRGMICGRIKDSMCIFSCNKDKSKDSVVAGTNDNKSYKGTKYAILIPLKYFPQVVKNMQEMDSTTKFGEACRYFEDMKMIPTMPALLGITSKLNLFSKK